MWVSPCKVTTQKTWITTFPQKQRHPFLAWCWTGWSEHSYERLHPWLSFLEFLLRVKGFQTAATHFSRERSLLQLSKLWCHAGRILRGRRREAETAQLQNLVVRMLTERRAHLCPVLLQKQLWGVSFPHSANTASRSGLVFIKSPPSVWQHIQHRWKPLHSA